MRALTYSAAVLFGLAMAVAPASAACKRFGFTVNDYGKDGPTKDAKELLDKHIAEWAAQNKIKDYKTGTKTVNCELFLNFVVFDEHTCTASANVCWGDSKNTMPETAATTPADGEAGVPPTPIRKAVALGHDKKTPQTVRAEATPPASPAAPETPAAAPPADTAAVIPPAEQSTPAATEPPPAPPAAEPPKAAEVVTPPPPPAAPAVTETGTLPKDPLSALKKHAAADAPAPVTETPAAKPGDKKDPAAASAAATAAAAAAERAAVAAETAAAAAKEAAAAAVAASAASKGAVVPPLDGTP